MPELNRCTGKISNKNCSVTRDKMDGYTCQLNVKNYTIYYGGMEKVHQLGVGFAVYKNLVRYVKELNLISERRSTIRLNTNPIHLFIINVHVPAECKEDIEDIFYEEITKVFYELLN